MSPRMFLGLSALVAAAVFFIGLSVGRESASASTERSSAGFTRGRFSTAPGAFSTAPGAFPTASGASQGSGGLRPTLLSTPARGGPGGERGASGADADRDRTFLAGGAGPDGSFRAASGPAGSTTGPAAGAPGGPQAPSAPADAESALTFADRAFQDPSMKFSILAITYTRTEAHAQMALETYDLLDRERFPVIHPIQRGSRIYVFVGAAKTMGELEPLRDELRELQSSRSGAREFRSAYLVNIAPYR